MILTYVDKYEAINFDILSRELGLPVSFLVGLADELFLDGFINSVDQKIHVTDKGKTEVYNSWNEISINRDDDSEENFEWNKLYVPENFLQKL